MTKLEELRAQKLGLQEDGRAAEKKAFRNFCKRAKVKEIADFETGLFSRPQQSANSGGQHSLTPE